MRVFVTSTLIHLFGSDGDDALKEEDGEVMADLCAAKAAIADEDQRDAAPRSLVALFRQIIAFMLKIKSGDYRYGTQEYTTSS